MKRIKCPECGQKVIPWAEFPESLHATVSCSTGVVSYVTKEEYEEARQATPIFGVDWTCSDNAARDGEAMVDDGIYPELGQE